MDKKFLLVLLSLTILIVPSRAWAGGAVAATQQRKQQQQMIMQQQMMGQPAPPQAQQQPAAQSNTVVDEVDLSQIIQALKKNSEPWTLVIDPPAKVAIVSQFIDAYRKQGVKIQKQPVMYAQIIDDMLRTSPEMLNNSFDRVLMIVAIIEYDFDNGQDKDQMALKVLGQQAYQANKERLGRH